MRPTSPSGPRFRTLLCCPTTPRRPRFPSCWLTWNHLVGRLTPGSYGSDDLVFWLVAKIPRNVWDE